MAIKEQDIVDRLGVDFRSIDGPGESYTDVSDSVYYDEPGEINLNNQRTHAINYRLGDNDIIPSLSNTDKWTIDQEIEIDVLAQSHEEVTKLTMDIFRVIGADLQLNGLVMLITRGPTYNEPTDQQGNKVADRRLTLIIRYRTSAWSEE